MSSLTAVSMPLHRFTGLNHTSVELAQPKSMFLGIVTTMRLRAFVQNPVQYDKHARLP